MTRGALRASGAGGQGPVSAMSVSAAKPAKRVVASTIDALLSLSEGGVASLVLLLFLVEGRSMSECERGVRREAAWMESAESKRGARLMRGFFSSRFGFPAF